jgi:hypothetical protein
MSRLPDIYDDDYEDVEEGSSSVYLGQWCNFHLDNPDETKYLVGKKQNNETMPEGTYLLLNVVSYLRRFREGDNGGLYPEHIQRPPQQKWDDFRAEQGDMDESLWPTDDNGNPRDPYQKVQHMHMLHVQAPKYFTLTLHTFSAFDSIRDLMKEIRQFRGVRLPNTYAEIELHAQPAKIRGRWRTRPKFVLTNRWLPNPFVQTVRPVLPPGAAAEAPKAVEHKSEPNGHGSSIPPGTIMTGNPNYQGEPNLSTDLDDEIPV